MSIRTAIPSDKGMTNKGIANFVGIGGRSKKIPRGDISI